MTKGKVIGVYLDLDLLKWIDEMVKERVFAGRSHAIQSCVFNQKQHIEQNRTDYKKWVSTIA